MDELDRLHRTRSQRVDRRRSGPSNGDTVVDTCEPFDGAEDTTLKYRADPLPAGAPSAPPPTRDEQRGNRRPERVHAERGVARHPAAMPGLRLPDWSSELTPETVSERGALPFEAGATVVDGPAEAAPFCSELTPLSEDCLTPGLLTPEAKGETEEHPGAPSDSAIALDVSALPDVKRALEAMRVGRSHRPPGTLPYGCSPPETSATAADPATPSGASLLAAPTPKAPEPAARKQSQVRLRTGRKPSLIGALGWMVAVGVAGLYAFGPRPSQPSPEASPPSSCATSVASVVPGPAASSGSAAEFASIAGIPSAELTPEQWVLLANARVRAKNDELRKLGDTLLHREDARPSEENIARLRNGARDPHTASQALLIMASLRDPVGPDLVYQAMQDGDLPAETRKLARDLLATKALQARASEALDLVLEIDSIKTCAQAEPLLMRVVASGDRRVIKPLLILYRTRGCGPAAADDCYPCLRKTNLLSRAIEAARRRRSPL